MESHFFHLAFAAPLFGAMLFDNFFIRAPASLAIRPEPLIARWRKKMAIFQMVAFLVATTAGLITWLPLAAGYPRGIFHTKIFLAVVFLILAKLRMLRERKYGVQFGLTRAMTCVLTVIFILGIAGGIR